MMHSSLLQGYIMEWFKNKAKKLKDKVKWKKDPIVALEKTKVYIDQTISRQQDRLTQVQTKIIDTHKTAIAAVKNKNKRSALHALKLKKSFSKQEETLQIHIEQLTDLLIKVEATISTLDTTATLRRGVKDMKQAFKTL